MKVFSYKSERFLSLRWKCVRSNLWCYRMWKKKRKFINILTMFLLVMEAHICLLDAWDPIIFILVCHRVFLSFGNNHWGLGCVQNCLLLSRNCIWIEIYYLDHRATPHTVFTILYGSMQFLMQPLFNLKKAKLNLFIHSHNIPFVYIWSKLWLK